MTKKIEKNEFCLLPFSKELSEFIRDAVNKRAKNFINTSETMVNETTITMIKKGEERAELKVNYNLKSIKKSLLDIDIDGAIKEIETTIMLEIFSKMFE